MSSVWSLTDQRKVTNITVRKADGRLERTSAREKEKAVKDEKTQEMK